MSTAVGDDIPLTRKEFAALIRITPRTLVVWAREGYGPRPHQISPRRTVYDRREVAIFIAQSKNGAK